MTVQAPLIYGYPLNDWCVLFQDLQPRSTMRLTAGQARSLRAIGCVLKSPAVALTSDAIKEVF